MTTGTMHTYHESIHANFSGNLIEDATRSSAVGVQHCIQTRLWWTTPTATNPIQMLTQNQDKTHTANVKITITTKITTLVHRVSI